MHYLNFIVSAVRVRDRIADPTAITRLCHLKLVYGDPRIKPEVSSPVLREIKVVSVVLYAQTISHLSHRTDTLFTGIGVVLTIIRACRGFQ